MRLRAISALAVAVLAAVFLPVAHASASPRALDYPPKPCPGMLSVSTTHPQPGETITVTGTGFTPGAQVHLVMHSKTYDLGTFTANDQGSFVAHVTLPQGVFGRHLIVATSGAPHIQQCPGDPIQIQPPGGESSGPPGPPGTSFTGTDLLMILVAAAVLIGAGVVFMQSGKRRKAEHV